jgi:hypothetical protein
MQKIQELLHKKEEVVLLLKKTHGDLDLLMKKIIR